MRNVIRELIDFNQGRDPERLAMKFARMSESPFAFLRGSCHLFYAQLPRAAVLRKAPLAWACGDLHLENLGSYRGDNGQVYFDINDFDEALRAPASWDLLRVLCSVHVARKTLGASKKEANALCALLLESYGRALADGKARWVERETAQPPVRDLLVSADASHQRNLIAARTKKGRIKLDGKKALRASDRDHERVHALFDALQKREQFGRVKVRDVARRVAGTGSLGLERWVVLVEAEGAREQLLDLKIATPAASVRFGPKLAQPAFRDDALRIVGVQRRMQAIAMASLHAVKLARVPFVLRTLLPSEDRVKLASLEPKQVGNLLRTVAECLAWDQLRSSGRDGSASADVLAAFGQDRSWRPELLALAVECAAQVERDYDAFTRSLADGELQP
ncbi:MAG TPA: DUF2252 family protein [Polyangiales bacterium]|nr:DUF2252 family protein [Polyangiales bacterium]